jgi:DNA-binding response OmpR family regulator
MSAMDRRTILVADDDADLRVGLQIRLRANGYDVDGVGDGGDAIDAIRSRSPDVLVLDLGLPTLDGFDVMSQLRNIAPMLSVVVVTARADEDCERRCLAAGARAFFRKPADNRALLDAIARCVAEGGQGEAKGGAPGPSVRGEPTPGGDSAECSVSQSMVRRHSPARANHALCGDATILLAEDDGVLRSLIREVLRRHGYAVLVASNATEAHSIASAHHGPIHLLVADMVMPGETGRSLARRLAAERAELRVLLTSGNLDESDPEAQGGAHDASLSFLRKPFTPEALLRRIQDLLQRG